MFQDDKLYPEKSTHCLGIKTFWGSKNKIKALLRICEYELRLNTKLGLAGASLSMENCMHVRPLQHRVNYNLLFQPLTFNLIPWLRHDFIWKVLIRWQTCGPLSAQTFFSHNKKKGGKNVSVYQSMRQHNYLCMLLLIGFKRKIN